ncbi:Cysteine-rich membrane protein 1 [Spironucleus salmonicida]|uniref:Cysteine-rich membrane protein 1 n=1 Tax=Spironucleus salmonicida TaxID=348837 RepID=V6LFG4_9EUKA|nr:Cysteine-rich membrane protein 1 [Spironucleus salmonicida]|eukprot:EST42446.1 Cysteine-rich membrane protein 1 [Spironucleus salmonicida]
MAEAPGTCNSDINKCADRYFCTGRALEQNEKEMPCAKCKDSCLTCAGLNAVVNHCASCKAGEYLSHDNYCRECHADCPSCTGPEQTCDGCKDGFQDTLGECEICPGEDDQENDCVCGTSKHCLDCNPSNMKQCASCQEGYDISSSIPCKNCLPGYVSIAIKDENICVECDNTCRECSGTKTTCTACNDGFILSGNTCTKCLAVTTQICPCGNSLNCTTCNLNNTNACATCKEHYDKTASPPCSKCEPKYFEQNITNGKECTPCRNQCETCMDANKCLTCKNGSFLKEGKCEYCYGGQEIACTCGNSSHCGTCDEKNTSTCLTCMHGFDSSKVGACDTCSEGFFKKVSKDNFTCEPCTTANCGQCFEKKEECTKCVYNMYLNEQKQCQQCAKGDGIPCDCGAVVNCDTCSTIQPSKCGECFPGYVIDKKGSCTLCALNYVQIKDKCVKCGVDNCQTCSADAKTCEKCRNNFIPKDGKCEPCSENGPQCLCGTTVNCSTCKLSDTMKCKSCVEGYQIDSKETCTNCALNYIKIGDKCAKCQVENCATCKLNDTMKCQTCLKGYQIDNTGTCTNCAVGYEKKNGKCEFNCELAVKDGEFCQNGQVIKCGTAGQTVECTCGNIHNCKNCQGSVCSSCMTGYLLASSACNDCDKGYELQDKTCVKSAENQSGMPISTIAGIVGGILVVIGVVSVGLAVYLKKQKKQKKFNSIPTSDNNVEPLSNVLW